ncbi:hypothetical protein CTheo_653 [Ceratobasidium theobromae]|uniref:G-patch domain-containing protein n=1 Tax=Ceratobasidium theobromae TaxID=1582974 RepID=A0A5N5QW89_9AGAM|nr:hypothetical protein CTheo_653 [Ceratobasidium theobromae]
MATEAFRIVSHYTAPGDEDSGTVQKEAILSSDIDALWESEAGPSNISLKRRIPPRFVPATGTSSSIERVNISEPVARSGTGDIGSWYAGLSRSCTPSQLPDPPTKVTDSPAVQTPAPKPRFFRPTKNNWFISRALSNLPADAAPARSSSLADMLEQAPPSLEKPVQPPVFLHLGPNNRGWGMLRRHGWEEGQPLGLGSAPVTPIGSGPSTPGEHSTPTAESQTGDDTPPANVIEEHQGSSRTALITPIRTTLKVDKRGIGPSSKSMPRPAITHSLSDIRIAAERARRERDGRGKRGFARAARRETEERSRLFQELNSK